MRIFFIFIVFIGQISFAVDVTIAELIEKVRQNPTREILLEVIDSTALQVGEDWASFRIATETWSEPKQFDENVCLKKKMKLDSDSSPNMTGDADNGVKAAYELLDVLCSNKVGMKKSKTLQPPTQIKKNKSNHL